MERKRKEILFPLLVVLCTAILFFALGYIASGLFGTPYVFRTDPASKTEQTSGILATENTTSDFDSIDSIPSDTLDTTTATTANTTKATAVMTTKAAIVTTSTYANISNITTETNTPTSAKTTATETQTTSDKINLNTATKEELMEIPGIGPVIADHIIQYREDFGPFTELIQLMEVKGIGEKRYNNWVKYFTID